MRLIFCGDPLNPRLPDAAYADEIAAANLLGIASSLINYEALVSRGDGDHAVSRVAPASEDGEVGVYRGWMMTPDHYAALFEALADRRVRLINTPEQYEYCHYLPCWYKALAGHTPRSVWTTADDISLPRLMALLQNFGDRPAVVKDYVKSRKHEWQEACFIPSARDAEAVARVTERFLALQGSDLNGGLVLREFAAFELIGSHAQSGMPLTREYRLFFSDGKPIQVSKYWNHGDYAGETPPLEHFTRLAALIDSRFFTMDVAKTVAGEWLVVELGDAQVSELPEDVSLPHFWTRLAAATDMLPQKQHDRQE